MVKTVFSKLDKQGFEYASQIPDLSDKEMHTIMWLFGKRKNKYGSYSKKDKDDVYHSILDNIDSWRDIAQRKIYNMRNKNINNIEENKPDLSNMEIASKELLKQDEVFYESINTDKLIKNISEGIKHALNEISDDLIKRARDKAETLGYHEYARRMDMHVNNNYKVRAKFEMPEESIYALLVENTSYNNIDEQVLYIVIGIASSYYYNPAVLIPYTIKISIKLQLNESFFDNAKELDANISIKPKYDINISYHYENLLDIDFKLYFSKFVSVKDGRLYIHSHYNVINNGKEYINTYQDSNSNYKGKYSLNKIIKKVFPTLRKKAIAPINLKLFI